VPFFLSGRNAKKYPRDWGHKSGSIVLAGEDTGQQ